MNQSSNQSSLTFITDFPCFHSLTVAQAKELLSLMQEVDYKPHETIVRENELVDSVYIILAGEAEVAKLHTYKKKSVQVPVALLQTGEAIGLNDTGFYSTTGKRTATVTAVTDMKLLQLDIKDLYAFLKKNNLELAMSQASLEMLRMRFIKQSLPFAKISHERLQWLAQRVEEVTIAKNKYIFKEGEAGDKCYFVYQGKIEIISHSKDHDKQLAVLKPPVLFGEATLITHGTRNASARAIEDSKLLVLNYRDLSELIESDESVANMFMTLMIDRSRPIINDKIIVHERPTADGQLITILKNVENGKYFKLSPEGAFIWQQLDGMHTLQDITLDLAEQYNVFAPDIVAGLIAKLAKYEFITNVEVHDPMQSSQQSLGKKLLIKTRKIINYRYAFGDADNFILRLYQKYIWILFTTSAQIILSIFAAFGIAAFIAVTPEVLDFFAIHHLRLLLLLGLLPLSLLATFLHELGHAFAVKACGREVHYMGVGWSGISPMAFTDTSDMWLGSRRQRLFVNFAGVYVDVLVAGLSAVCLYIIPNAYVQSMLWLFALYIYIRAIRMLSPLQSMDGYYILMDWLEKPRLKAAAVIWLVKKFPQCLRRPKLFKLYIPEIIYWLACIIYLIVITIITLLLQLFVLDVLRLGTNLYLMLILPFLVVIFSSLGVIIRIKNQVEE